MGKQGDPAGSSRRWAAKHRAAGLVKRVAYRRVPTDDNGHRQPDWWFDGGVSFALSTLIKPGDVPLIHGSMGINRGPSMGPCILLELGREPIADVGYAQIALGHYRCTRAIGTDLGEEDRDDIEAWSRRYL
jgi:hypothetical protein